MALAWSLVEWSWVVGGAILTAIIVCAVAFWIREEIRARPPRPRSDPGVPVARALSPKPRDDGGERTLGN